MNDCEQTIGQSVYQHGISVKNHLLELIDLLKSNQSSQFNNWKIPDCILKYKEFILQDILPINIIEEYAIFHDCGKPFCKMIDENGKSHFPNHAEASYNTWINLGGNISVAKLIRMDMIIHTMKANDIDEFIRHDEAITLLLSGLAEIHSNANMFGGIDSLSFKIKWNQINKRGSKICEKLYGSKIKG